MDPRAGQAAATRTRAHAKQTERTHRADLLIMPIPFYLLLPCFRMSSTLTGEPDTSISARHG